MSELDDLLFYKNMKKINIEITKAKIISYQVDLKEEYPDVTATIGLYTENDKQITTFTLSTESWRSGVQFDLPIEFIDPIKKIADELETILTRQASASIGELVSGE